MIIDCDTCVVRGPACGDCVVTVLLGAPPFADGLPDDAPPEQALELDHAEQAAIAVLAGSGLVPPLRLVPGEGPQPAPADDASSRADQARRRAAEAG